MLFRSEPEESIFAEGLGISIGLKGVIIGLVALLAFYTGWRHSLEVGRTMAFITLAFSQFGNSLSVRSLDMSIFEIGLFSNKQLVGALVISSILMLSVVFIPFLRTIFDLTLLEFNQWIFVIAYSLIPITLGEIIKKIRKIL